MRNSDVATARAGHELLSADFLTQLERLSLLSRRAFRGRVKGERRSPRKGISVEFSDYRPYGVGDDLRYVDWNVYARLDRLYLKLFVDEEDLCLHLLVDASASMGFGEPSKLDYAARLAGALGFVGLVNLERVGVGVVRDRMAEGLSPARGRSQAIPLHGLPRPPARGRADLAERRARRLRAARREAGLAVLISDLMDPGGYERGLKALLERRFDVHVDPRAGRRRDESRLRRRSSPDRRGDRRGARPHARRRGPARLSPAAPRLPRARRAVLPGATRSAITGW